ncbi:glycosyltransferase [Hymenobacter crusticola]|uniref:Mannosyl transferase n=1 Tax=Hymenobacter crusticola TaxID=1770526 RepID=A0A243WE02_9BACT|nr:glycosyltransferase [Hymenobacter crusticola]OUJ73885.1 mannosyl transferase [Hymenobacter crusticola]
MHLVFFTHPDFMGDQRMPAFASMPRFARMLAEGMRARGHQVEMWAPRSRLFELPVTGGPKKWLGYVDQYLVFPMEVRQRLKHCPPDTLFVFADNALGPWVPLVADRPHVMHCHDFMAQRSALGQIPENPTGWSGRQYQRMIRAGYSKGKHFISVSRKTREELHTFLPAPPLTSEVVYNGLSEALTPYDCTKARTMVGKATGVELSHGYLLHVGGNQWYKNRLGVIELYNAWRSSSSIAVPLLLIGGPLTPELNSVRDISPFKEDIHVVSGLDDELVHLAYAGATVFLFPSIAEGFGWPIAEAMASGCLVITTGEAPMTEVAGEAGFLIPRRPHDEAQAVAWAAAAAKTIDKVVHLPPAERSAAIAAGITNVARFNSENALNRIEEIYKTIQ